MTENGLKSIDEFTEFFEMELNFLFRLQIELKNRSNENVRAYVSGRIKSIQDVLTFVKAKKLKEALLGE